MIFIYLVRISALFDIYLYVIFLTVNNRKLIFITISLTGEKIMKRITAIVLTMAMALSMAGCTQTVKNTVPAVEASQTKTADIVIVGAGAAGLAAAGTAIAFSRRRKAD